MTSWHVCVLTVFCGRVSKPTNDLTSKKKKRSKLVSQLQIWIKISLNRPANKGHAGTKPAQTHSWTDGPRRGLGGGQPSLSTLFATSSVALPALTSGCFWSKLLANVTQLPTQVNIRAGIMHLGFAWVGTRGVSAGLISSRPSRVTTECLN